MNDIVEVQSLVFDSRRSGGLCRRFSVLRGILLITLMACSASVNAAIIELNTKVTLTPRSMIELGDIAQVSDSNSDQVRQLNGLAIAPAPAAGRSLRVTYEEVRSRLQACGVNLTQVEFRGGQAVDVRIIEPVKLKPEIVRVNSQKLPPVNPSQQPRPIDRQTPRWSQGKADDLVTTALRRAFRTQAVEARGWTFQCHVDPNDVPRIIELDHAQIQFQQATLTQDSTQKINAVWLDAEGRTHIAQITVVVSLSPMGLALRQDLPQGAMLRPEDLVWAPAADHSKHINRITDVIGKQLTRHVRAGTLLQREDLDAVALVRSNEIVSVIVQSGGITVRRPFKSLSTGALNETINLCALDDSRVRLQAVVTGFHEATVFSDTLGPASATTTTPVDPALLDRRQR